MVVAAWDIETCPTPLSIFTEAQRSRYETELRYKKSRDSELDEEEACRLVRSTHPFLGWICCISVAFFDPGGNIKTKSWTAETPKREKALLQSFWESVADYPKKTRWVTFNGKRFDIPFVLARSTRHSLAPTRSDLTDTYPYNHSPHADLMKLWPSLHYRLAELCAHLGVASPKAELSGAGVADAVAAGRIDQVARYCEGDVRATLACWQAARPLLD